MTHHFLPILNFWRNIKGRFDLFCLLYHWDPDYKKEFIITLLAFALVTYSVIDLDSSWDYMALVLEFWIIALQFGSELSIMPRQYRPKHGGVNYTVEPTRYISYKAVSYLMAYVLPVKDEEDLGFANPIIGQQTCTDSPLCSDDFDDALIEKKHLLYQEDKRDINFIKSRHQIRYIAVRVANKRTHTTNGQSIALPVTANQMLTDTPIRIRKSYYFNALMTMEAFRSRIFRQNLSQNREVYTDLSTYFPVRMDYVHNSKAVRFRDDFLDHVSCHIGVTALLVTENKRLALLYQGANRALDANTVAFGGSGSISYSDIAHAGHPKDFRVVVRYGMAREMAEETGMQECFDEIRANMYLTGFFRWINRSGKPEFIGLCYAKNLPIAANHAIDGDEVVGFEEVPIDIHDVTDFKKVYRYIQDHNIKTSLSSLMALHRMAVIADYNTAPRDSLKYKIYQDMNAVLQKA